MGIMTMIGGLLGCRQQEETADIFKTPKGEEVRMYCVKHGSFYMSVGDKWFYIDPVGEGLPPVTDYSVLPKADYILVTHEHGDHMDPAAIDQLRKEGTVIIANPNAAASLDGECCVMENGTCLNLKEGWTVHAVPAYNYSQEKLNFHPKGRDNGYVLNLDGFVVYVAGDTEDIPEMSALAAENVDVAFLPCNLPYTMTPEQCANAAKMVSPRVLFPYHYGQTRIESVCELLDGCSIDVRIRQYQ